MFKWLISVNRDGNFAASFAGHQSTRDAWNDWEVYDDQPSSFNVARGGSRGGGFGYSFGGMLF